MTSSSAGTKSEAAGPSAWTKIANAGWLAAELETTTKDEAKRILRGAMDPALGDDRLVVAGVERQRIVNWLRKFEKENYRLPGLFAAFEREFGGES